MIALEQLSVELVPWHRSRWIRVVLLQQILNCLNLGWSLRCGLRTLGRNAVPKVLRKLDPLGDGETEEVGSGLAHSDSIDRGCLGLTPESSSDANGNGL